MLPNDSAGALDRVIVMRLIHRTKFQPGKKAEIAGQVFIYLLTIVIMGLMFYFGVKWMIGLMNTTDDINTAQLKIDFETSFDSIRSNYASSKDEVFDVPSGTNKVCFVDEKYNNADKRTAGLCDPANAVDYNPTMCNTWMLVEDSNIFFEPPIDVPIYIKNIDVEGGYKCFVPDSHANTIRVKLIGLGDGVKVSEPDPLPH